MTVHERYRTLHAMLRLREFTITDLAWASGVKQATVRTVLARHRELVNPIGVERSGKRGGSPTRYRLRPDGADRIREELGELELFGKVASEAAESELNEVPASLRAAEDILLTRLPEANLDDRHDLLALARTLTADGQQTIEFASERDYHKDSETHLAACRFLLRLGRAETRGELDTPEAVGLQIELARLMPDLALVDDGSLAPDVLGRVRSSPVSAELDRASALLLEAIRAPRRILIIDAIEGEGKTLTGRVESWAHHHHLDVVEVLPASSRELGAKIYDAEHGDASVVVTVSARQQEWRQQLKRVSRALGDRGSFAVIGEGSTLALKSTVYGLPRSSYVDVEGLSGMALGRAIRGALAQLVARPLFPY